MRRVIPILLACVVLAIPVAAQTTTEDGQLIAASSQLADGFGVSIAIDGQRAAVATTVGRVHMFSLAGGVWTEDAVLTPSNVQSGLTAEVDLDADVLVFSPGSSGAATSQVTVFRQVGSQWTEEAVLQSTIPNFSFGSDVAVSGSRILVGDNSHSTTGAALVFHWDGNSWVEEATLKPALPTSGGVQYGFAVDLDGDLAVVGGLTPAVVFSRESGSWVEQATLDGPWSEAVSIDGTTIAEGGDGPFSGQARMYQRNSGNWQLEAAIPPTPAFGSGIGRSVDLCGNRAVIGSPVGAAFLYERAGSTWSLSETLVNSDGFFADFFGAAVALDSDSLLVGAPTGLLTCVPNCIEGKTYYYALETTECFLVVGDGFGRSPFTGAAHLFATQVGPAVEGAYPISLDDLPTFTLPVRPRAGATLVAAAKDGPGLVPQAVPSAPPEWLLDGECTVQVLMWNPQVFPGQPEQYSAGLAVKVLPNGNVVTTSYGTPQGGLSLSAEVLTNTQGQKVIRFPFTIEGF